MAGVAAFGLGDPAAMTALMSSVTDAVSHLPAARGPGARGLSRPPCGGVMMSAGLRGAGTAS